MHRALFLMFFYSSHTLFAYMYLNGTGIENHLRSIEISESTSGIDRIDCIYVINLDIKPSRWTSSLALFSELGIHINRVNAVNGWELSEAVKQELCGPYPVCRGPRPGGLGCLLSHLSALKDALERDFGCIWICEDDVEFLKDPTILPTFLMKLEEIDPEWDIFYTDLTSRLTTGPILPSFVDPRPDQAIFPLSYYQETFLVSEDMMRIRARHGTYSMIISKKGIKKILEYYSHVYFYGAYDIDIHYIPDLKEYCPTEDIVSNLIYSESYTWNEP